MKPPPNIAGAGGGRELVGSTQHFNAPVRHEPTASRELDWLTVAQFCDPLVARFDSLPLPGSPEWVALPDCDPAKVAAVLQVGRYWVFDHSCRQEALTEASQAISAAADWGDLSRQIRQRRDAYIVRRPA
ncbi:DUF2742 domain-containing protein [Mycobacterium asiaticum]|uniref:DUF2742 domain-containing protein n=1 Tax=Mycobacterium asiaticum TaxID=1790 RepID=UPI0009C08E9C|nr:DUF2742 domain-containing protein [Mycobacterium asiaticum]